MEIMPGADVNTKGATGTQQADIFQAFGVGNNMAYNSGKMSLADAAGGLAMASQGEVNAINGIPNDLPSMILLL